MKQFVTFSKLELLNLFGLNVLRHLKDPAEKKKKTLLMLVIAFLVILFGAYLTFSAYGLVMLGVGEGIPMLYPLLSSILILIFGLFKAKSSLYRDKDLDLLASLPAKSVPIAGARLIRILVENALINACVILPTFLTYAIFCKPGAAFFVNLALALLILPILPTALMAWFGILVAVVVSRNRHKVLTETIFVLVIVVVSLLLPAFFSGMNVNSSPMKVDFFSSDASSDETIMALSAKATQSFTDLKASFPLIKTWGSFFLGDNFPGIMIYGLGSALFLFFTALVIGKNFFRISAKLRPINARHEFEMKSLRSEPLLIALTRKEAKRYFSSGVYVSNTFIGPVFAVVLSVLLLFFDPATLIASAGGGIPENINVATFLPFLLGMTYGMMTISASSLSMEGKNWWILQSLPVCTKDVLQAKLLFNLIFVAPFYGVSQLLLLFTPQESLLDRLWLIVVPAASILFSVTFGLFCNLKFPKFQWESEIEVVKQSAACGLSLLGVFILLIPGIIVMILPSGISSLLTLGYVAVLLIITFLLYRKILSTKL